MTIRIGIGIDNYKSSGGGAVAPSNTVAPVASGTAIVGQTLSVTNGTWTGTAPITYTYQWKRNNVAIGSATNATYVLVAADAGKSIKCTVTATNTAGNASQDSNTISVFGTILDIQPSAATSYSFDLLRGAYYGSASVRVRRSSDDAEQDIGHTSAGVLDESALTTFTGANDGFVVTWYDQSGNTRHITQATKINQPKLVASGTVQKVNGKPAAFFDGSNDTLSKVSSGTSNANTWVSVHKLDSITLYRTIIHYGDVNGSNRVNFMKLTGTNKRTIYDDTGNSSQDGTATTNQEVWTASNGTNSVKMWVNGASETITNSSRTLTSNLNLIQMGDDFYHDRMVGYIQEEILWQSTIADADIDIINANINSRYAIY